MGMVVKFPRRHARASAGSATENSSSGTPVARLKRTAKAKDGARHPVSMRETVAGVVDAASATSLSERSLATRWARNGCMPISYHDGKTPVKSKLSMTDKDVSPPETYAAPMVVRIGPKKPRQRAYIREHRKALGWSQDELAGRVDTTGATISRYETGSRDYPGGFLAAVAEAMGKSEADMYRLPDLPPAPDAPPSLDEMLRDAPPAIQELARAAARAILETNRRQEPQISDKKRVAKK